MLSSLLIDPFIVCLTDLTQQHHASNFPTFTTPPLQHTSNRMPSTYTFLMLSACFHLSCTFVLVFMLVNSSIVPPLYLCLCLFMLTLVLCLPYYSCWSLHSCLCSLHTYHSCHASWSHLIHAFTPIILVTLFFICAFIFLSSSYAIQLVHSIRALAYLIKVIPAHHFINV